MVSIVLFAIWFRLETSCSLSYYILSGAVVPNRQHPAVVVDNIQSLDEVTTGGLILLRLVQCHQGDVWRDDIKVALCLQQQKIYNTTAPWCTSRAEEEEDVRISICARTHTHFGFMLENFAFPKVFPTFDHKLVTSSKPAGLVLVQRDKAKAPNSEFIKNHVH